MVQSTPPIRIMSSAMTKLVMVIFVLILVKSVHINRNMMIQQRALAIRMETNKDNRHHWL